MYFAGVLPNPGAFMGEAVIWGGRIIGTVNHEGYTTIKILQMALDSYGRPQGDNTSMGRFMGRILRRSPSSMPVVVRMAR